MVKLLPKPSSSIVLIAGVHKLWTNIVPNSQVVAFPYMPETPDTWLLELYVPTDTKIFTVVMALLITMLALGVPIGWLTWKERKEDQREKLDSSHLFSYDAL